MTFDPENQEHLAAFAEEVSVRILEEFTRDPAHAAIDVDDRLLVSDVLQEALKRCPDLLAKLVGTSVIEEDYLAPYDPT